MVALSLVMLFELGQVEMQISDRPVQFMTRRELKAEYAQLDATRPGIGLPVTLFSVGAGMAAYGGVLLASSLGNPGGIFRRGNEAGYLYVAILVIGASLIVPGIWLWWIRREDRAASGARMDAISAQLEVMEKDEERYRRTYRPERRDDVPPPPRPNSGDNLQL